MDPSRQCTATSTTSGERCRRAAILGGTVCPFHGGSAPAVKRKAAERLAALQDPAVDALHRSLEAQTRQLDRKGRVRVLGDDHPTQIRAATAVLDRTGLGPSQTVDVRAGERLASLIAEVDAEGDGKGE
jgi:ethanolamine utilization microcompartment shell protein EutL